MSRSFNVLFLLFIDRFLYFFLLKRGWLFRRLPFFQGLARQRTRAGLRLTRTITTPKPEKAFIWGIVSGSLLP